MEINNSPLRFIMRIVFHVFLFALASRPVLWLYGIIIRRLVVKLEVENEQCYRSLNSGYISFIVVLIILCALWVIGMCIIKRMSLVNRRVVFVLVWIITLVSQGLEASLHPLTGGRHSDIRTKFVGRKGVVCSEEMKVKSDNLVISLVSMHGSYRPFERFNLTDMEGYSIQKSDTGWFGVVYLNNTAKDRLMCCLNSGVYVGYRVACGKLSEYYEIESIFSDGRIVVCTDSNEDNVIDFFVRATTHGNFEDSNCYTM